MSSTVTKNQEKTQPDYTTITEHPGNKASHEQLSMLYTRYHFASHLCRDKDVLEVACGSGVGLGYLAQSAKRVVGVDIDEQNLEVAKHQYTHHKNVELKQMDAHKLDCEDNSFDAILLFEAIYYLENPEQFIAECRRVLRDDGVLLINSVNPEWRDYNPSPFSFRYFSAKELSDLLEKYKFQVQIHGAFPVLRTSVSGRVVSVLKRTARSLGVIPKTMKGKAWLKRLFFGKLEAIPNEVNDSLIEEYHAPVPICNISSVEEYKVLYALGHNEGTC